jgi:hypothetical protein
MLSLASQPFGPSTQPKVVALSGTQVVGEASALVFNGSAYYPLSISGDSRAKSVSFILVNQETGESISANEICNYSADKILGSVNDPFSLTFGASSIVGELSSIVQVSPNPFNESLRMTNIPEGVNSITIFDMQGRSIRTWQDVNTSTLEWDGRADNGSAVPAGAYLLQMFGDDSFDPQVIIRSNN